MIDLDRLPLPELLELQHGVLSRQQAQAAGLSSGAVRERSRRGKWQSLHRGVFAAFSGPLDRESQLWAAVLRVGTGATLSHETAAELTGLLDRPSELIHVTAPANRRPRPAVGIRIHRSTRVGETRHPARLPPQTRVEDTVLDLVDIAPSLDSALSWVTRGCGKRLTTPERVVAAVRRRTRLRWRRELLEGLGDVELGAHSTLEVRYLRDVERAHGLPQGKRQAPAQRYGKRQWDDVVCEEFSTVVALDGRLGHTEDGRFRDMSRDNAVVVEGRAPLRYGWSDVSAYSCEAAAQLTIVLWQRGWVGRPQRCGPSCRILDALGSYNYSNAP